MKRLIAVLSVAVVLTVTAFSQTPLLSAKAGCCTSCCDKCSDCCGNGGCDSCCQGN